MAHEDYKEMLAAQALSALDPEDARALNQHLLECDECRRELADWELTAANLAWSANPAEPSRQVRERIMSAVRSERQPESRVVSFPQSRRDKWTSLGPVGAIAAAVLFMVLIIWIIVLWQQNRALHRETEFLARDMQALQEEAGRSNEFVRILSSPGARIATLSGSGPAPDATARLVYDRSGRAMLLANNLPPTPEGKEYQLWFIVGRNPPIPGKTFTANFAGRGDLSDEIPEQAMESAMFAVTLERAGGATAPTSAIYLRSGL
jgi:anti-sigma-K factor RskA